MGREPQHTDQHTHTHQTIPLLEPANCQFLIHLSDTLFFMLEPEQQQHYADTLVYVLAANKQQ
jgi:hypothetical protein